MSCMRESLLSTSERTKTPYTSILTICAMVLFTIGVGLMSKLMFDIHQQLTAIRQNMYLMCNVLPLKSGTCVHG